MKIKDDFSLFSMFFILLTGIWVFTDSSYISLLYSNIETLFIINFMAFMLIPFTLLLQTSDDFKNHKFLFYLLFIINIINFITCTLLQLINKFSFYNSLIFTHLIYLLTLVILIYIYSKNILAKKSFELKVKICNIILYSISLMASFIAFISNKNYSIFFMIGTFIYFLSLLYISIFKASDNLKTIDELTDKAYLDALTKTLNRQAYNKEVNNLSGKIRLSIFDINNLKFVNDNLGHENGDKLIADCANVLKNVFGHENVFRFGGDEFIAIEKNYQNSFKSVENMLTKEIKKTANPNLSISKGYCEFELKKGDIITYQKHFLKADELMYKNKKAYHRRKK